MKVFGIILIVLGILSAAGAGTVVMRQKARDSEHRAESTNLETQRSEAVKERTKLHLAHQATLKSIHNQPDSLRMEKSGEISMRIRSLGQEIRMLTMREKELARLMRREDRHSAEEWAEARRKITPLGTAGLVLLIAGGLLSWRARQRA